MSVRPSTYRPLIEPLEQRELPAGNVQTYVTGGILYLTGTNSSDTLKVLQTGSQISVAGMQISVGNARVSSIDASSISRVMVYGNGGNDNVDVSTLRKDAVVSTGSGNDIIRCGSGNTVVYNGSGFDWIYRPENLLNPVTHSLDVSDIRQGQAPVCQTAAALAEALKQGHNFANDIRYLGNYYYQVKLNGGLSTQKVYFDGWTNSGDLIVSTNGDFWAVLMERARLQALGIDPLKMHTVSEWNDLNTKTGGRLYSVSAALYDFTGRSATFFYPGSSTPQKLHDALADGALIVAPSRSPTGYVSPDGIIGNHAYAVLAIYQEDGLWKVKLYNPWGLDSINGRTIDALDKSQSSSNDGYITLTWQQFTNYANFQGYYLAPSRPALPPGNNVDVQAPACPYRL